MWLRILKKDLKRKTTTNIIMFAFMVMASLFVASGLNNVMAVINGTEYYLDQAGVGDYIILTQGDDGDVKKILETHEDIKASRNDDVIRYEVEVVSSPKGKKLDSGDGTFIESVENSELKFFDADNHEVLPLEKGHAYVTCSFMKDNNLKPGDKITIKLSFGEVTVEIDEKAKDAVFGSDFMGNTRFLLSDEDYKFLKDKAPEEARGHIYYIDTDSLSDVVADFSECNIVNTFSRSTIKMCYVLDLIKAFMLLIVSVCLIAVAFDLLKFAISFTILEEYREIGVMKAIGIGNAKIRLLYMVKYLLLAVVGCVVGFFGSIPFGNYLLKNVSENMLLGNTGGLWVNVAGSVVVLLIILIFVYGCTNKIKTATPVDAIRSGQTGERYNKKSVLRLNKFKGNTSSFMAINDVLSAPKRFASVIITFMICTLLLLIIVNTVDTMDSDALIGTICTKSDLYYKNSKLAVENMTGHSMDEFIDHLDEMGEELKDQGMPAKFGIMGQFQQEIVVGDDSFPIVCKQDINCEDKEYEYITGIQPENENEIAVTPQICEMLGVELGDRITINYKSGAKECVIVGVFESFNQLGQIIQLSSDAPTDFSDVAAVLAYQIDFTDNPDKKEIENRKEKLKKYYDTEDILDAREYCIDCMSSLNAMSQVRNLLLVIISAIVILMTLLVERSFIESERSQIAILKAMGFGTFRIIRWQIARFGLVAFASSIIAAVLSIPVTKLCITPIFAGMGVTRVSYVFDYLKIIIFYPGMMVVLTVATAAIVACHVRKIFGKEIFSIE